MRLRLAIGILGVCAGFLANTAPTNAALEPEYTQESVQLVGTCGNVWAKADVVRQYVFNTHRSHVDVWRLRTREGQRFTTFAGASPNACSTDIERGVSIIGGIHSIEIIGGMYIYVDAPAGSFDGDAVCQAPCTAGQFVAAFYGTDTTWTAPQGFLNLHVPPRSAYWPLLCKTVYVRSPLDWPGPPIRSSEDIASTC